jgi:hypothetical protein
MQTTFLICSVRDRETSFRGSILYDWRLRVGDSYKEIKIINLEAEVCHEHTGTWLNIFKKDFLNMSRKRKLMSS